MGGALARAAAKTAEVRSSFAPSGVESVPVPWKFRPVSGFWNSESLSICSITSLDTSIVFML